MADIKEFKYKLIKNFFTKEELHILQKYCMNKLDEPWTSDPQSPLIPSWYKDALMNSLLENKLPLVEKETGLQLFKTYAFWRYYAYGSILQDHKDRPSCEISVTVNINGDGTAWPIFMEGTQLNLQTGDAAIYLGCEVEHWREEFKGDYQFQTFLHYVDAEGKNKEHYMDKRKYWGCPE